MLLEVVSYVSEIVSARRGVPVFKPVKAMPFSQQEVESNTSERTSSKAILGDHPSEKQLEMKSEREDHKMPGKCQGVEKAGYRRKKVIWGASWRPGR